MPEGFWEAASTHAAGMSKGAETTSRAELTSLEDVASCEHRRQGRRPSLCEVLDHDVAALVEPEDDPDSHVVVLVLVCLPALPSVSGHRRRERRGRASPSTPRILAPVRCGRAPHFAQRLARGCAEA